VPHQLATFLCFSLIVWLLVRDVKANPTVSHAIWIPWIWFLIKGSKSLTLWIYGSTNVLATPMVGVASIDRYLIMVLIVLGIIVVTKRSLNWATFITKNWAFAAYLFYALVSIMWSDVPGTVFNQWHHMFLQFLMVLVVFTEQEPAKAFYSLFKRAAYVLIPLSVLFIKYYPERGRSFDFWTGFALDVGVTDNKNKLGEICWVLGLIFLSMLFAGPKGKRLLKGTERYIAIGFFFTILWLLLRSQTSTALIAFLIGASIIIGLQSAVVWRNFTAILLCGCFLVAMLLAATDIKDAIILALGEDLTLTGRTELWADLEKTSINPVLGAGFESFWSGGRMEALWQKYWWHPNQAHNGYFEVYLNLGIIGLFTFCAIVLSCYVKARRRMSGDGNSYERRTAEEDGIAQFRLAFLLAFLATNWTDAAFRSVNFVFLVFVAIAIEYAPSRKSLVQKVPTKPVRAARLQQAYR